MYNNEIIQEIKSQAAPILDRIGDRSNIHFKLGDLNFDGKVSVNDIPLDKRSISSVMGALRVKREFPQYANKMTPEAWAQVSKRLKEVEGDTRMIGRVIKDPHGASVIDSIFYEKEKKKSDADISFANYFAWLEEELNMAQKAFKLYSFAWDDKTEKFSIAIVDKDSSFNPFGSKDGEDWKVGSRFTFTSTYFDASPFFERQICTNGATAPKYGFATHIGSGRYNTEKIRAVIKSSIENPERGLTPIIEESVKHLVSQNISLAEFYHFRNFFSRRNENNAYDGLIDRQFSDRPFYRAYGENIEEKSHKWKSTATTGINAYDFYNHITWLASHPEKEKIAKEDLLQLQIEASNLLFKPQFDLEDIAGAAKVEYPRLSSME